MEREYIRNSIRNMLSENRELWTHGKGGDRPEVQWLQQKFHRIQNKYGLKNRTETDRFIYERMYEKAARTPTDWLKVRYWRTGRCIPANRERCIRIADALELTGEEWKFLIQAYYNGCETLYDPDCFEGGMPQEYMEKYMFMKDLVRCYLDRIPEERLRKFKIDPKEKEHYFRHLYFTDAFHYVSLPREINPAVLKKHITSARYDSELRRQLKLSGEIPRRTMLRHLLILNAPEITIEKISRQLSFFGYLPLDEKHTLPGGEHMDFLILALLRLYENEYDMSDPGESLLWFQEACRVMDEYFAEKEYPRMRFMHFKALEM